MRLRETSTRKSSQKKTIKDLMVANQFLSDNIRWQSQVIEAIESVVFGTMPFSGPGHDSPIVTRIAEQINDLRTQNLALCGTVVVAEKSSEEISAAAVKGVEEVVAESLKVFADLNSQIDTIKAVAGRRDTMIDAFIQLTDQAVLTAREQAIFRAGFVASRIDDAASAKEATEIETVSAEVSAAKDCWGLAV